MGHQVLKNYLKYSCIHGQFLQGSEINVGAFGNVPAGGEMSCEFL
jgi:hypothetical protein